MSTNITIELPLKSINIYPSNPQLWYFIKKIFIFSYIYSSIILSITLYSIISPTINIKSLSKTNSKNNLINFPHEYLYLLIGKNLHDNQPIYIPEYGLYQNILITGTIGTGKTSSAMYPFTNQLISYYSNNIYKKLGMLILDVKGNYYNKVLEYAKKSNRLDDVIVIELDGKYKYNPLHKPHLKPSVLANQLKSILLLFSPNNTESYWLDKTEDILREAIKLCRFYNSGYVTFNEIHKLVTQENYLLEKIEEIRNSFQYNKFSKKEIYDLLSCISFFKQEFLALDSRTLNILKSEITRITNSFITDYSVMNIFCSDKRSLNFYGFKEVVDSGKIVVLNMNINEYRNLSKIIAAYLKIDFQTEIMSRLAGNSSPPRTTAFISDEYSEYVTSSDANFFSQSRESKCINIISTQSYTSLINTLNNENATKVIVQNLVNKIWFRTDDIFTIEYAQKQLRKNRKGTTFKNHFREC